MIQVACKSLEGADIVVRFRNLGRTSDKTFCTEIAIGDRVERSVVFPTPTEKVNLARFRYDRDNEVMTSMGIDVESFDVAFEHMKMKV